MAPISADEARRLREEVARLRAALEDAVGPRGSTCTTPNSEMTDAEWMRRHWRNAIDQWGFWQAAYEADIGKPEFVGSWRPWRENALRLADEVERLSQWKQEATHVIEEWEAVHAALGKPGRLGEPKAAASRHEVERLTAENERLRDALTEIITESNEASSYTKADLADIAASTLSDEGEK